MAEAYGAAAKTIDLESLSLDASGPKSPLDADAVRLAYRRWAGMYDMGFGLISKVARRAAVTAVNQASGRNVLEVGVGTGLALPLYAPDKHVTGIDLSAEMLGLARDRVASQRLRNIETLLEMDAQATSFPDGKFDIAVAMFVASVVPSPRALVSELRRVVRPGGTIVFVNHFAADRGPISWIEHAMAPSSRLLGWHPDFQLDHMLSDTDLKTAAIRRTWPLGLFRLIEMPN